MTDDERTPVEPDDREDLPPGVPEPPDMEKVEELRRRMEADRRTDPRRIRLGTGRKGVTLDEETGRRAREIGLYTIIPMMLLAGPAIGYLLGLFIQRVWGGTPWPTVAGALFGLAAAFRQIFLLLARKTPDQKKN